MGCVYQDLEVLVEDLMESLAESEQDTTLGIVAKHFTEATKAQKKQFQVPTLYAATYSVAEPVRF